MGMPRSKTPPGIGIGNKPATDGRIEMNMMTQLTSLAGMPTTAIKSWASQSGIPIDSILPTTKVMVVIKRGATRRNPG